MTRDAEQKEEVVESVRDSTTP